MRKGKRYVTLSPAELRLVTQAVVLYRNKLIEKGMDTIVENRILLKLYGKDRRWRLIASF